ASGKLDSDRRKRSIKQLRSEMLVHHSITLLTLIGANFPLFILIFIMDVYKLWWWLTSQFNDDKKIYYRLSSQYFVHLIFMFCSIFYLVYH
ncbi:hypothetical protein PENTCL1PPCAC_27759, partial [Pristionchus entomophagus]